MDTAALVIALIRFALATEQGDATVRFPRVEAAIDWPAVLRLATEHRVLPLLQQALASAPKGTVPEWVAEQLEAITWQSQAATMLCEHELASLLALLGAAGINVLVLKGAALAHTLYSRPELRPYHDIDIVCRPADCPRLDRALTASGYTAKAENEPWVRRSSLTTFPVQSYTVPSGTLDVEVHTDILQLGLVERQHEHFWSESCIIRIGTVTLPALAPVHQMLHLAAHVQRHGYVRLLWLVDVDQFIRRWGSTLDWNQIATVARDEGMGWCCAMSLQSRGQCWAHRSHCSRRLREKSGYSPIYTGGYGRRQPCAGWSALNGAACSASDRIRATRATASMDWCW